MRVFWFIFSGVIGGLIGGMGMGGGTLLIPLLTVLCRTEQHLAQSINLLAFIPMSVAALIIHAKNKLLRPKYLLTVALPAAASSVPAALLVRKLAGRTLSRAFGVFLAVLGLWQLVSLLVARARKNSEKKKASEKNLYKCVYK